MRDLFRNPTTLIFLALMLMSTVRSGAFNDPKEWLVQELLLLPGIIIGLSFHEFAHAWVADRLGDPTPRGQGRVTIAPQAHIDMIGLLALIFVGFGWGKPVPINPRNFSHPRRDELLVSVAGVAMNLILAIVFTFVLRFYTRATGGGALLDGTAGMIGMMIFYCVWINLVLMIFNLIPVPPLDGFNILTEIFNLKKYRWWYTVYERGYWILLILILFNFTSVILNPCINFFWEHLSLLL